MKYSMKKQFLQWGTARKSSCNSTLLHPCRVWNTAPFVLLLLVGTTDLSGIVAWIRWAGWTWRLIFQPHLYQPGSCIGIVSHLDWRCWIVVSKSNVLNLSISWNEKKDHQHGKTPMILSLVWVIFAKVISTCNSHVRTGQPRQLKIAVSLTLVVCLYHTVFPENFPKFPVLQLALELDITFLVLLALMQNWVGHSGCSSLLM